MFSDYGHRYSSLAVSCRFALPQRGNLSIGFAKLTSAADTLLAGCVSALRSLSFRVAMFTMTALREVGCSKVYRVGS